MPQVIVTAILSTSWAGAAAAAGYLAAVTIAANIIAYTIWALAMAGLSKLLRRNPGSAGGGIDRSQTQTIRQPAASRKLVYGQCRIGGVLVYAGVSGTNKEFLHLVVAHCGGQSQSFDAFYLNDDVVTLDGSGNMLGKYAGYGIVKTHLGTTTQTVDTTLQTAVGSSEWTNNHRLRGITYSYVQLKHNPDIFPSGIPNYSTLLSGRLLYDPRSGTTVFSKNAMLVLRDYMLDIGDGLGADVSEWDDPMTITGANICDEAVALNGGGSEARYAFNGVIDTSVTPGSVIEDILSSMAGWMPYSGGKFRPFAGAWIASSKSITLDDLAGPIESVLGDSLRDCFNLVKGTYLSPTNQWQEADFPVVTNASYVSIDGAVIPRDIVLPFTISTATAQRLSKIELEFGRRDKTITIITKLTCLDVRAGDTVDLTMPKYGWTNKTFQVQAFEFTSDKTASMPTLLIKLTLREYDANIYNWSTSDEIPVPNALNPSLYDPTSITTPGTPTLSTSNFMQSDGTISPRMQVSWTPPNNTFVTSGGFTYIEYKKSADPTWLQWAKDPGNWAVDFITDVQTAISYDVRIRFENITGVKSLYSATATYTVLADTSAPAAPTGMGSISTPGSITVDWDNNTEADLAGYVLYRNTVNSTVGMVEIWRGAASAYTDFSAGGGTKYYATKAYDRTNNFSAFSAITSGTANPATGNFIKYVFKVAASTPSAPTGNGTPSGWFDAPPGGTNLYMSSAEQTSTGILVGSWSSPVQLNGANGTNGTNGTNGDSVFIEYSVDGITGWHSTFTTGDFFMHIKIGTGGTYGAAIKISGEISTGEITTIMIANAAVTDVSVSYTAGSISTNNPAGGNRDLQTVVLTTDGSPVSISASVTWVPLDNFTFTFYINRDGTDIDIRAIKSAQIGDNYMSFNFADQPSSGSHTYILRVSWTSAFYQVTPFSKRFLQLIQIKR